MNQRIILVCFAGRRANLEAQWPFIERILNEFPKAEYHLWNLTRNAEDGEYVRSLHGHHDGRVRVLGHLHPGHPIQCTATRTRRRGCTCLIHKPPYEAPYAYYAADNSYGRAIFVKLDDDVLFIETARFGEFIAGLQDHPNAVISANVVNNVVSAKHDTSLREIVAEQFNLGDVTSPAADRDWWWLHTDPKFALASHEWFLDKWEYLTTYPRIAGHTVRSRPGERISINTIAFTWKTMRRISAMIAREERLGDEGAVDRLLPRIDTGFRAAHLTFGPQDAEMKPEELDDLRARYAEVAKEYLG